MYYPIYDIKPHIFIKLTSRMKEIEQNMRHNCLLDCDFKILRAASRAGTYLVAKKKKNIDFCKKNVN